MFSSYFHKNFKVTEEIKNSIIKEIKDESNFYNESKSKVINNIYKDVSYLYDELKILEKLDLNIVISLVGGSVRDLIFNKEQEIKDIDLMISVESKLFNNNEELNSNVCKINRNEDDLSYYDLSSKITQENLLEIGFSKEELKDIDWNNNKNLKINQLIKLCLNRKKIIKEEFLHKKDKSGVMVFDKYSYGKFNTVKVNNKLDGVFKLNKKELNYDVDILVTHKKPFDFLRTFDFNFCKASIELYNKEEGIIFPKDYKNLNDRLFLLDEFYADYHYKKIIFRLNEIPQEEIIRSVQRYKRLSKKYKDFDLVLDYWEDNPQSLKNKEIFEKCLMRFNLEEKLANKSNKKTKNKI